MYVFLAVFLVSAGDLRHGKFTAAIIERYLQEKECNQALI